MAVSFTTVAVRQTGHALKRFEKSLSHFSPPVAFGFNAKSDRRYLKPFSKRYKYAGQQGRAATYFESAQTQQALAQGGSSTATLARYVNAKVQKAAQGPRHYLPGWVLKVQRQGFGQRKSATARPLLHHAPLGNFDTRASVQRAFRFINWSCEIHNGGTDRRGGIIGLLGYLALHAVFGEQIRPDFWQKL